MPPLTRGRAGGAGIPDAPGLYNGAQAAAQLAWQAAKVDLDDPADCLAKLKSNRLFGWLMLGGMALAAI